MECDFLSWQGGIFGSYYCQKENKTLDKYTINTYCDNSLKYRECPIYKKNSSSQTCYLTTAMCNTLGFEDDCLILNTLRKFRDNHMKTNPEYSPLLEDYNIIGPEICNKINNDENKIRTAHIMLIEFITPAINFINNKKYDEAIEIYKNMTLNLMEYYNVDTSNLSYQKNKTSIKQRKR